MNRPSQQFDSHLVPPEEQRCVWMTAGVLTFQLCDRDFECDTCPLDAAMRMHCKQPQLEERKQEIGSRRVGTTLRPEYDYTSNHCWLRKRNGGVVRVGLEPGLAALLTPKAIAFPSRGDQLAQNQICLWIVTEGGTFPLLSPVNGTVLTTNTTLTERPHELVQHPFDQGWLFDAHLEQEVEPAYAALTVAEAEAKYAGDVARFKDHLVNALPPERYRVGQTLADGGAIPDDVEAMIGQQKYCSILCRVFG
jgi:glycine cleavage system H lipoate-binding protein